MLTHWASSSPKKHRTQKQKIIFFVHIKTKICKIIIFCSTGQIRSPAPATGGHNFDYVWRQMAERLRGPQALFTDHPAHEELSEQLRPNQLRSIDRFVAVTAAFATDMPWYNFSRIFEPGNKLTWSCQC